MSFDRSYLNPSIDTHVPVTVQVPKEDSEVLVGRPDLPTPSLWQNSVLVTHRETGRRAVVHRMDWSTNMFRPFWPDLGEIDPETKKPKGKFAERTEWEHCKDWIVSVTFSPAELERQAAREQLDAEIATMNAEQLGWVTLLVDDPDPARSLAKLHAIKKIPNLFPQASVEAVAEAVAEVKAPKKGPAKGRPPTDPDAGGGAE